MITNIGSLGLDMAWVPIVPYSRVPILLAVGEVRDIPVAENGEIVVRKVMKINATFDHRFNRRLPRRLHVAHPAQVAREPLRELRSHPRGGTGERAEGVGARRGSRLAILRSQRSDL